MPTAGNAALTTSVLLRGEETGGQVSITEIESPPQAAGPRCTPSRARPLHARLHARGLRAPLGASRRRGAGVEPRQWAMQPIPR